MPSEPAKRQTATERRAKKTSNPFATTSASHRRTQKRLAEGKTPATDGSLPAHISQEQVAYLLEHPTREVPAEELQKEYGFVLTDIRNMFMVAGGLILLEIILALVLPK